MNGNEMFEALAARGPHPDIAQSANAIYAPFVGSWDVEVFDLECDGARRVSRGEWHFAWILEGRAMQDVLMVPPRGERRNGALAKGNRCATTLRVFDSASGMWRVHYFNPTTQTEETFTAKQDGRQIVQAATDGNGATVRETFSGIDAASFRWRREISDRFGSWKLKAEYIATRRS
jgi:hypothetical protein